MRALRRPVADVGRVLNRIPNRLGAPMAKNRSSASGSRPEPRSPPVHDRSWSATSTGGAARPATASATRPENGDADKAEALSSEGSVVGIGASLDAAPVLDAMFRALPRGNDMSFVLILSDAPGPQAEALRTALAATSPLSFVMAGDGMTLEPGRVYVAGSDQSISLAGGRIRLAPPSGIDKRLALPSVADKRLAPVDGLPIDSFLESLALDYAERAIAVVLAGPGSDGALGVRAIKDLGGATLAQDPDTATPRGMPEGAVATGLIDQVLDPGDLAARLLDFASRPRSAARDARPASEPPPIAEACRSRCGRRALGSPPRDATVNSQCPIVGTGGGMDSPTRACPRAHDSRSIAIRAPANLGSAVRNRCRCVFDLAPGGSDPRGPRPEPRSQDSGYRPRRTRPTHRAGRPLPRNSAGRSLGRAVSEPDPRR